MPIEQAHEAGKHLGKWHIAPPRKGAYCDIRDIRRAVTPAPKLLKLRHHCPPEGVVHHGVLVDRHMDGQNTVVSRKVEVAAPVLVAIFHNAARAPKVHLHQRVHWL